MGRHILLYRSQQRHAPGIVSHQALLTRVSKQQTLWRILQPGARPAEVVGHAQTRFVAPRRPGIPPLAVSDTQSTMSEQAVLDAVSLPVSQPAVQLHDASRLGSSAVPRNRSAFRNISLGGLRSRDRAAFAGGNYRPAIVDDKPVISQVHESSAVPLSEAERIVPAEQTTVEREMPENEVSIEAKLVANPEQKLSERSVPQPAQEVADQLSHRETVAGTPSVAMDSPVQPGLDAPPIPSFPAQTASAEPPAGDIVSASLSLTPASKLHIVKETKRSVVDGGVPVEEVVSQLQGPVVERVVENQVQQQQALSELQKRDIVSSVVQDVELVPALDKTTVAPERKGMQPSNEIMSVAGERASVSDSAIPAIIPQNPPSMLVDVADKEQALLDGSQSVQKAAAPQPSPVESVLPRSPRRRIEEVVRDAPSYPEDMREISRSRNAQRTKGISAQPATDAAEAGGRTPQEWMALLTKMQGVSKGDPGEGGQSAVIAEAAEEQVGETTVLSSSTATSQDQPERMTDAVVASAPSVQQPDMAMQVNVSTTEEHTRPHFAPPLMHQRPGQGRILPQTEPAINTSAAPAARVQDVGQASTVRGRGIQESGAAVDQYREQTLLSPTLQPQEPDQWVDQPQLDPPVTESPVPVSQHTRRFLQPLGIDPASVRIYRGPQAERVTAAYWADAVTIGDTIALAHGHPDDTPETLGLLAHELTHVARQRQPGFVPPILTMMQDQAAQPAASQQKVPSNDEEGIALHIEHVTVQAARQIERDQPVAGSTDMAQTDWGGLPAPWEPLPTWLATSPRVDVPTGSSGRSTPSTARGERTSARVSADAPLVQAASGGVEGVQRAALERDLPAELGLKPASALSANTANKAPEPDLDLLARQVYAVLKRRLSVESRLRG